MVGMGTGPGCEWEFRGKDEDGLSAVRQFLALSVSKRGDGSGRALHCLLRLSFMN